MGREPIDLSVLYVISCGQLFVGSWLLFFLHYTLTVSFHLPSSIFHLPPSTFHLPSFIRHLPFNIQFLLEYFLLEYVDFVCSFSPQGQGQT